MSIAVKSGLPSLGSTEGAVITKDDISVTEETSPSASAGEDLPRGKSAYEVAVENGFSGTETEWLASLKGEPGAAGAPGKDGTDGKTPYVGDNGNWFVGSDDTGKPSRGAKGDKGDTGAQGIQGEQGIQGVQGEKGEKGDTGAQGIQGVQGAKGDKGDPGATPNLTIGSVTTLEAGQNATASITGESPNLTLNLGIPKGANGEPGESGGGTDISLGLTSAAVGQIIKVKAVDESGKPTAWEAANMPSGGGDTLLYHYDTSEDAIITSTALVPNLDISTTALLLFKWHINGYGTEFGGRLMINNQPITKYFPYIHRKAGSTVDIFCAVAVSDASLTVIKFVADSNYFTDSADFVCANGGGNSYSNIINITNSGTIESFGIQGATVTGTPVGTPQDKGEHLDYTTSGFSVDVYKVV